MKLFFVISFLSSIVLLSSCATVKHLKATGGSKSDGTIKLSYEYGWLEEPKVDMQEGTKTAQRRCSAWGYTGAEAFTGSTEHCVDRKSLNCDRWLVTIEFQCTGNAQ